MRGFLGALVLIAGAASPVAAPARVAPAITLVARAPLTVSGAHFAPRASVTVTVESLTVKTRTNASGRFRVVVRGVRLGSCSGLLVRAAALGGQRASLRVPPAACMTARG